MVQGSSEEPVLNTSNNRLFTPILKGSTQAAPGFQSTVLSGLSQKENVLATVHTHGVIGATHAVYNVCVAVSKSKGALEGGKKKKTIIERRSKVSDS